MTLERILLFGYCLPALAVPSLLFLEMFWIMYKQKISYREVKATVIEAAEPLSFTGMLVVISLIPLYNLRFALLLIYRHLVGFITERTEPTKIYLKRLWSLRIKPRLPHFLVVLDVATDLLFLTALVVAGIASIQMDEHVDGLVCITLAYLVSCTFVKR